MAVFRCHRIPLPFMSSLFPNAQGFKIIGSEFIGSQIINNSGPSGIDVLLEASVPDAAVDAEARQHAPSCFPGTREQYIHDITHWAATSDEGTLPIYWMTGPAGVGKSAIAQTCAENVKKAGHLGAAFFFSISGRNDPSRFFTTLAYQLSTELHDYRSILNTKISNDKTLVRKTLSSQFNALITEPLQELERQGKGIGRRAIFVDGLDECREKNAQCQIIEIIATSVLARSTPFRWAIFSRTEPHIEATFDSESISPVCCRVLLSISREADGEIELYIRGEFKNILRRRKLLSMSSSWPTEGDIRKLVDASAGLYAYPAAVLRYIDHHSSLRLEHTLQDILNLTSSRKPLHPISPFAELDALYMLIMERVLKDSLPSVQLFLTWLVQWNFGRTRLWHVAILSNVLGFSETEFRGICDRLHAVLEFHEPAGPPKYDERVDTTRSYFEQEIPYALRTQVEDQIATIRGVVQFHHKSFFDFIIDPKRSSTFCVTTPTMREKLLTRYIQCHRRNAESYDINGTNLVLAPGVANSSDLLCWPHGSEFVDSYIVFTGIWNVHLIHDGRFWINCFEDLPLHRLQDFIASIDFRKTLIAELMGYYHTGLWDDAFVLGADGVDRVLPGTLFSCLDSDNFKAFDSVKFLKMVKAFEKAEVITRYHPNLPSGLAAVYHSIRRQDHSGKRCGQYKFGHASKAVYWYWEFDVEAGYFHEFRTLDFTGAMAIYQAAKFEMWKKSWVLPTPQP